MISTLALYAVSAVLLADHASDRPMAAPPDAGAAGLVLRDEAQPRDENFVTPSQAQASPDEAQPVRASHDASSKVTHAEKSAAAPRSAEDAALTDDYFFQQRIWTSP